MLSKSHRIAREAFWPLLESRKYAHSAYFSLKMAQGSRFKAAVSVSKKVSKKAVVRNRVRRRAYAALEALRDEIKPGLYLFMAKPGSEKLKTPEIASELATLLKKS